MPKTYYTCPKCHKKEARRAKHVYNPDGSKNTSNPLFYYGLFILLGVTVTLRLPEEWQLPIAIAIAVIGTAVVVGLILYRRKLRRGFEYQCWSCEHFWHEIEPPAETPQARG